MTPFRRIAIFEPSLILEKRADGIFDRKAERRCLEWAGQCLARGADCFMLRIREVETDWSEELLFTLIRISDKRKIPFLLNMPNPDREIRASGFHFKDRQSLAPPFKKDSTLFGKSIHSRNDAQIAEAFGFDYLFFSPVFRTESHPYAEPQGLEALSNVCSGIQIPVFALGGINLQNIEACFAAGAAGIAGIRMWL